jgi:hypothetical protein
MTDLITLPRATVQQALETWEHINLYGFVLADYEGPMEQAITALKAALEQPEQEPVAWMVTDKDGRHFIFRINKPVISEGETLAPLYTTPPRREWRGLTEEEFGYIYVRSATHEEFARAVEQALKEKNHG